MMLLFAIMICVRMPEIILKGRFWCEEGNVFFHNAWVMPPVQALFNSFGGYLNLAANGASLAARWLLPIEYAPYLTITVALLAQLCPLLLLISARDIWLERLWIRVAAALLVLFVPAVEEIWLNSLHCQFQLTLCCGIILGLEPPRATTRGAWFRYALLFVAPLCGPGAIVVLPLFILRAILDRSVARAFQILPLMAGSILQLALFFHHEPSRGYALDPTALLDIFTVRHLMLPFLGIAYTTHAAPLLEARRAAGHIPLKATVLPLIVFGPYLLLTLWRRAHWPALWLLLAGGLIACASYFGAIGGAEGLIHARAGGRYSFVPQALFSLSILAIAATGKGYVRLAWIAVVWLIVLGGSEYVHPWSVISDGPSWRHEVKLWRADPSYQLNVWYSGWTKVELPAVAAGK